MCVREWTTVPSKQRAPGALHQGGRPSGHGAPPCTSQRLPQQSQPTRRSAFEKGSGAVLHLHVDRNALAHAHRNGAELLELGQHPVEVLEFGAGLLQFQVHIDGLDAQAVAGIAARGGGGRGLKVARTLEEIPELYASAVREAIAGFGRGECFVERYLDKPRHVETQVLADKFGNAVVVSTRDCSLQRRHQKLVEETPSPFMTEELRTRMGEAAVKATKAVNYEGVGTIEFLVDKNRDFYFMEMNTRIQVEHTITEEVVNYDLIKEQIKIAAGEKISGNNYYPQMHAIQCRINALKSSCCFIFTHSLFLIITACKHYNCRNSEY